MQGPVTESPVSVEIAMFDTFFAPARRSAQDTLLRERDRFASFPNLVAVLNALPTPSMVLNENRQILFANRGLLDFLGGPAQFVSEEHIANLLGQRFGEAVHCLNSKGAPHGCGSTQSCCNCGAAIAVLDSQDASKGARSQECRMLRKNGADPIDAVDLRVTASALPIDGEKFTLMVIQDISAEKRREALERIFFHDLLNTATGMQGLANMINERNAEQNEIKSLSSLLCYSSEQLVDEIVAQRTLNAAETNELIPYPETIELLPFVQKIAMSYSAHDVARDRYIRIAPESQLAMLQTDASLLRRILINLLKNGLESSKRGETVTLTVRPAGDKVRITIHNIRAMTDQVQAQVFNRSFSTRGVGRGLGTYSVKLLVERYLNGTVSFISGEPEGTSFIVTLPVKWPKSPSQS